MATGEKKIMNIEFIDENTVKITASIGWRRSKPPFKDRKSRSRDLYIAEFKKEYPSYTVKNISGPADICNYREKEDSKAEWTLTVSKKEQTPPPPKVEAAAPPKPHEPPPREERRPDQPRRKLKRRLIKTKKGA
jgi:type IV secretory pathway VirB10-like protein